MAIATLATTRYVEVGTYIGQFFLPGAGSLPNEARVVCLVGKGDRLIVIKNQQFLRSFVFREQLEFSTIAPFSATLMYPSDGNQSAPVKLYTADGIEITANKWQFVEESGFFTKIQLLDTAFDPMATYYLDYQSVSRAVKDVIPDITISNLSATAQIREIMAAGLSQDQDEFREYTDYYIDYELDEVEAGVNNYATDTSFTSVNSAGASGTGTVAVSGSAYYSGKYNRLYKLEVTAAAGTGGTRTATIKWSATPVSLGVDMEPPTPLNPNSDPKLLTLSAASPLSLSNQALEYGVVLNFDFGVSNYQVGDVFYLQAKGKSLIELDPLLLNTNQFTEFSAIDDELVSGSTGSLVISSLPSEYTLTSHNLKVKIECIAASGTSPSRSATFVWVAYGTKMLSGSFVVNQGTPSSLVQSLGATGIKLTLSFGATHFKKGDKFDFAVKAPRTFYKGKESVRNLTLKIGTAINPANNTGLLTGTYLADTPEGRYGQWTSTVTESADGLFEIQDGLRFYPRNMFVHSSVSASPSGISFVTDDEFTMQARSLATLDFSLLREESQIFANPSELSLDVTGAVTGVAGARYITLRHLPVEIIYVRQSSDDSAVSFVQVGNTPFLRLTQSIVGDVEVSFRWRGGEPNPGQYYYVSAKYLRPESFYNRPLLFLTQSDAEKFLAPSTVRNDLYIASQIVFENAVPGLFVIQVEDNDKDGVYTRTDYRTAIQAFMQDKRATDLVVLNYFQALPDQLNIINRCNDPFELHESLTYVGAPINTPIGSEIEPNSLVFLAKKTLAVFGNSPAHGSRIMTAHTRATRTIQLEDGSVTEVTLDGSFIAAAIAGLVSSFASPTETILQKQITSFNTIDTFTDQENAILGGAGLIFLRDEGNGVYRIREDITTDSYSADTRNINHMTQKQFVTRDVRRTMNTAVIATVFPSAGAGVALIQSVLVGRLMSLESSGLIGRYQDEAGNVRPINPAKDAIVFRDPTDPTLFHIAYNYFLATAAKRIFGLYTVNLSQGFPT